MAAFVAAASAYAQRQLPPGISLQAWGKRESMIPGYMTVSMRERALRRLKKISGASRRGSLTFARTSPSVHSVQRPENISNLYPSLRLDGKQAGKGSPRLVAFSPTEAGH
jgi:hypothetical protein